MLISSAVFRLERRKYQGAPWNLFPHISTIDSINALEGVEKVNPRRIMPRTLQHLMETDKRFVRVGFFTPESGKKPVEAQQPKKSAEAE